MESGLKDGAEIAAVSADATRGHRVLSRSVGAITPHPTITGRLSATVTYTIEEIIGEHAYTHSVDVKSWADSGPDRDHEMIVGLITHRSDRILSRTMALIENN